MQFSIQTGPDLHPEPESKIQTQKLKTWLHDYHHPPQEHPEDPIHKGPVVSQSFSTPSRTSALKNSDTNILSVDELDKAFMTEIDRSHLCPYPLVIKVKEQERLQEVSKKLFLRTNYQEFLKIFDSKKYKVKQNSNVLEALMVEPLVELLNEMISFLQPRSRSHQFVNAAERTIKFADDSPKRIITKPDLIFVPKDLPPHKDIYWGDVGTFIELKKDLCKDLSTLNQMSRYVLAMIYCRPFMAVNYIMTITGNIARIYRYDAQSFCFTEGVLITNPAGFTEFCKFIAFMVDPDRQTECFRPGDKLHIQFDNKITKTYTSVSNDFGVLFNRLSLFGSRTACFQGEAHEGSNKHSVDHLVLKLTWVADRLQEHELKVLKHLRGNTEFTSSSSCSKVPEPLGTLTHDQIGETFCDACIISARRPHGNLVPLKCVSLVIKAPEAALLDEKSTVTDIIHVFMNLAKILLDVAKTGVQYRDFNTGNVLWTVGKEGSADCFLTDFGNARIENRPRGAEKDASTIELAKDDFRSCNEVFCSIASMESSILTGKLLKAQYSVDMGQLEMCKELDEMDLTSMKGIEKRLLLEIESLGQELEQNILNHFDDLQSAFFCFIYLLGQKSTRQITVPRTKDQKMSLLESSFGVGHEWFYLDDHKVQLRLAELMICLAPLVHPKKRKQVLEELKGSHDKSRLTKVEEGCFQEWITACNNTITILKKLKKV